MKTKPCRFCNGTGTEVDQAAIGAQMKKLRKGAGISLRHMQELTGTVYTSLFELELGHRRWKPELVEAYKRACK